MTRWLIAAAICASGCGEDSGTPVSGSYAAAMAASVPDANKSKFPSNPRILDRRLEAVKAEAPPGWFNAEALKNFKGPLSVTVVFGGDGLDGPDNPKRAVRYLVYAGGDEIALCLTRGPPQGQRFGVLVERAVFEIDGGVVVPELGSNDYSEGKNYFLPLPLLRKISEAKSVRIVARNPEFLYELTPVDREACGKLARVVAAVRAVK
jgi:hypothetical protein